MDRIGYLRIECDSWREIVGAVNSVVPKLAADDRKRLNNIFSAYLGSFGLEGVYERLNGRTVQEVFDGYSESEISAPELEGEKDGVRYKLYGRSDGSSEK